MRLWPFFVAALLVSCRGAPPHSAVHYTLGPPYQAAGVWHYPKANFSYDSTGIAAIERSHPTLTSDGELYSARAFAAAHPTLELPAIARVTNLENGQQVVVRINDRGPANPGRIIAVTPAVARVLGFAERGTARVRVKLLPGPSEELALGLPGGPRVDVTRAPVAAVEVRNLAPPPGITAETAPSVTQPSRAALPSATPAADLPGTRSSVPPSPGTIWVRTGLFTERLYADLEARKLSRFGARVAPWRGMGSFRYEVKIGPFDAVAKADAVLKEALAEGFEGARLVVE